MSYIVATYIDQKNWTSGLNWMRKAKSLGLNGFLITKDLSDDNLFKIKELGFSSVNLIDKFHDDRDVFLTVAQSLEGQNCLFTRSTVDPVSDLVDSCDLIANSIDIDVFEIASSVTNLYNRAKAVRLLKKKDKLLSATSFVFGRNAFWIGFVNFLKYTNDCEYFERRDFCDDLALNIYVSLSESINSEVFHHACTT